MKNFFKVHFAYYKGRKVAYVVATLGIVTIILGVVWSARGFLERARGPALPLVLKDAQEAGTQPRLEREYKFLLIGNGVEDKSLDELANIFSQAIQEIAPYKDLWQVPEIVQAQGGKYATSTWYVDLEPHEFLYRDIYLDTRDGLNYKNAISFRLRHRWDNINVYSKYERDQNNPKFWPYRHEIQVKIGRNEFGNGLSETEETRFEFRNESLPFNADNPAPPPPWDFKEYLFYAQTGMYKGYVISPGKQLARYFSDKFLEIKELFFQPVLVVLDSRRRIHFNINTPWRWGPNPEQAMLITLDKAEVFGPEYISYLNGTKKIRPKPRGYLVEVEIEFERNVSTALDEAKAVATKRGAFVEISELNRALEAFVADQQHIADAVRKSLEKKDIYIEYGTKSKYQRSWEIVKSNNH